MTPPPTSLGGKPAGKVTASILPSDAGTYALLLQLMSRRVLSVGGLGERTFRNGCYVYVGSALGSGGLAARMAHHFELSDRPRWHIDYLRLHATVTAVWFCCSKERWEHRWAELAADLTYDAAPVIGFGSTDCGCPSHLFHYARPPDLRLFNSRLRQRHPRAPAAVKLPVVVCSRTGFSPASRRACFSG